MLKSFSFYWRHFVFPPKTKTTIDWFINETIYGKIFIAPFLFNLFLENCLNVICFFTSFLEIIEIFYKLCQSFCCYSLITLMKHSFRMHFWRIQIILTIQWFFFLSPPSFGANHFFYEWSFFRKALFFGFFTVFLDYLIYSQINVQFSRQRFMLMLLS